MKGVCQKRQKRNEMMRAKNLENYGCTTVHVTFSKAETSSKQHENLHAGRI
jgi:hypothetical protein